MNPYALGYRSWITHVRETGEIVQQGEWGEVAPFVSKHLRGFTMHVRRVEDLFLVIYLAGRYHENEHSQDEPTFSAVYLERCPILGFRVADDADERVRDTIARADVTAALAAA